MELILKFRPEYKQASVGENRAVKCVYTYLQLKFSMLAMKRKNYEFINEKLFA